jgi:carbon monoxide dehydrogenase subunit G
MRFEKEFTVAAPLDLAWRGLDDIDVLASCLPGELRNADGVCTGEFALAADAAETRCQATLRPVDADEDEHATTVRVTGRQIGGPAIGAGTINCRASASGDATRVALGAEMTLTGYAAPTEVIEQRGQQLIEEVAERLRERLLAPPPATAQAEAPAPAELQAEAPAPAELQAEAPAPAELQAEAPAATPAPLAPPPPEPAVAQAPPLAPQGWEGGAGTERAPAARRYALGAGATVLALVVLRTARARRKRPPAS